MQISSQTKAALMDAIGETPTHVILALQWQFEVKQHCPKEDIEDFIGDLIAVCLQIVNNPPELESATLSTYLITAIRNRAQHFLNRHRKYHAVFIEATSLSRYSSEQEASENDEGVDLLDTFPDESELSIPELCDRRLLHEAIEAVETSVTRTIAQDFLNGLTPSQACKRHGKPRNYFNRCLISPLRKKLCNEIDL